MTELDTKPADPVRIRELAIELASLEAESTTLGVLFTPFHQCQEAAVSARLLPGKA